METYYLSLRPSSLNLLNRTIQEAISDNPSIEGTLFPTKGSLILFAIQTDMVNFSRAVDVIDKWDIKNVRELVSEIVITEVEGTLLMDMTISPKLKDEVFNLIESLKGVSGVRLQTHFPSSAILYKGNCNLTSYVESKITGFNKGEWLVCINKNGSPPLFIKDRV